MKNTFYILIPIICLLSYSHIQCNYPTPFDRGKDRSNWYFASDGRDLYHGHSPDHPKQTIDELNSLKLNPGDTIFFRSGDMWRERIIPGGSGSAGSPIVFTSYGAGDKPIISRSVLASNTGDWTATGKNLWSSNLKFPATDIGNLIFNDDSAGIKEHSLDSLNLQGEFYASFQGSLTMYSIGNPASVYGTIECAIGENAIQLWNNEDYLTFDGLHIKYVGRHGISATDGVTNLIVRNCDFDWIGGMEDYRGAGYRLGNGVELYGWGSDWLIEKNRFNQVFDAGATPQGAAGSDSVENIYVLNNLFSDCRYAWEFAVKGEKVMTDSIHFNNNTIFTKKGGFGAGQRWGNNEMTTAIMFFHNGGGKSNDIEVKNNIVYNRAQKGQESRVLYLSFYPIPASFDIDYNLYYNSDELTGNNIFGRFSLEEYYSITAWRQATNLDRHSSFGDPLFDNPPGSLYIRNGSPAIDAGVSLPERVTDFDGIPVGSPPNIGAYETIID